MQSPRQSLDDLAARVQTLTRSASSALEADRAELEARVRELDEALATELEAVEADVRDAHERGHRRWLDVTASMNRRLDEVRARHETRRNERQRRRAVAAADAAQDDAAAAIGAASLMLNLAEYAVIDAELARMAAEDLVPAGETGPEAPDATQGAS